jgi:hypothetical protein
MQKNRSAFRALTAAVGIVAVGALLVAPGASAHTGEFARFNNCPSTNKAVWKCMYSVTKSGSVVLGKKTVPIVNPVTLQGGFGFENAEQVSSFFAATNGVTLSKTPQPVPGGLTGLVNCKEISNVIERAACEVVFENGVTGVNATLELALPASEIKVSQNALVGEFGTALRFPVKVHLENPFLGSSCYIGSSSQPLIWNLTTGETKPPAGTTPLHGERGTLSFIEEGEILKFDNNKLVENNWPAPSASGCGGFPWEYLIDPIINASVGVPSAAGKNAATLVNEVFIAEATGVNAH